MKDDKKPTDYSSAFKEARRIVWSHRRRLSVGLVLLIIDRALGFVLPAASKYLIDDILVNQRADVLPWLAAAVISATLIQAATTFGLSQVISVAAQRTIAEFRKNVEQHVIRLPVSYFDSTKSGILISRILNDAEGIRNLVGTGLVNLVGGLLTACVALCVLFFLNWAMTIMLLVLLASYGVFMAFIFKKVRPFFRERYRVQAEVTGRLNEALGAIRTVKAFRSEKHEDWVFAKGVHSLFRFIARTITALSGTLALGTLVVGLASVILIWWGGNAVLAGTMTLGGLVAFLLLGAMVAAPVIQIASVGTQITEAFAGLDRIRELRQVTSEWERDEDRDPIGKVDGEARFESVHFEYEPGVPVLRGVSFHAPAGTTTALVGSSGSGKSTLISLIMAFNRPQQGKVLVDGQDLSLVRLREFRSQLGVVLQDNVLFDDTIAGNIGYASPSSSREEVLQAGRIAHCDEFVEGFEKGYDTVIGERGVKLSGGQRQRVAIARAILANPRILILDEATSSLDSESEARIQDGLKTLRQGRTTFVIAHRLSTIRSADQILVLEGGQIVERGTHSELLAKKGRYRELYEKQYQLESNLFINPGEDFTPEPEKEKTAEEGAGRGGFSLKE